MQRLSDAVTTKMRREEEGEDEEKRMYREQARALEESRNICEYICDQMLPVLVLDRCCQFLTYL